jgi:restriction system protein
MTLWVVRAGKHGEHEADVLDQNLVAIGYIEMGDLAPFAGRKQLEAAYRTACPEYSDRKVAVHVGQLWAISKRIEIGHNVALPLKTRSAIALGRVQSEYEYRSELPEGMRHTRRVQWNENLIPRSAFDDDILYSFGSSLTVFQVSRNNAEARVLALFAGESAPATPATEEGDTVELTEPVGDIASLARDRVVQKIERDFKGHELARLTGAILAAQGYEVEVSPPGPDGGVDVLAGRGGLGLEAPRICVQVKSGVTVSDVTVFRGLQGAMSSFSADYGLLVSWGGFTRSLQQEARQHHFKIRLWDQGDLVDALFDVYDKLPEATQAKLPLERIWVPVQSDEED